MKLFRRNTPREEVIQAAPPPANGFSQFREAVLRAAAESGVTLANDYYSDVDGISSGYRTASLNSLVAQLVAKNSVDVGNRLMDGSDLDTFGRHLRKLRGLDVAKDPFDDRIWEEPYTGDIEEARAKQEEWFEKMKEDPNGRLLVTATLDKHYLNSDLTDAGFLNRALGSGPAVASFDIDAPSYSSYGGKAYLRDFKLLNPVEQVAAELIRFSSALSQETPGDPYGASEITALIPRVSKLFAAWREANAVPVGNLEANAQAVQEKVMERINQHAAELAPRIHVAANNYRTLKAEHDKALSDISNDMGVIKAKDKALSQLDGALAALGELEAQGTPEDTIKLTRGTTRDSKAIER